MDIRFWIGATTRCTVAHWNNDVAHEPWSKLYLPVDGSARYAVARVGEKPRWIDLRPGRLYLVPGGRRQINTCRSGFTLRWCHFTVQDPHLLARLMAMDEVLTLPVDLLPDCAQRVVDCCGSETQRLAASALVFEALARLPDLPADALAADRQRLAGAVYQLAYHLDLHPTIGELAARSDLAPSQFQQIFRRVYGTSVHHYRLSLRIAEAKRLLQISELQVQEIAARCGYPNPYNFTRLFTRRCAMSPTQWRESQAPKIRDAVAKKITHAPSRPEIP